MVFIGTIKGGLIDGTKVEFAGRCVYGLLRKDQKRTGRRYRRQILKVGL